MVALSLASIEAKARDVAVQRSHDLRDWPTATTRADLDKLKRVLITSSQFFHVKTLDSESEDDIVVGRCAAIAEGAMYAIIARDLLQPARAERYASLAQTIRTANCRLTNVAPAWNQPPLPAREAVKLLQKSRSKARHPKPFDHLLWIPMIRGAVGLSLMPTMGTPLGMYRHVDEEVSLHPSQSSSEASAL
jgi:hypothetical protein